MVSAPLRRVGDEESPSEFESPALRQTIEVSAWFAVMAVALRNLEHTYASSRSISTPFAHRCRVAPNSRADQPTRVPRDLADRTRRTGAGHACIATSAIACSFCAPAPSRAWTAIPRVTVL
jgi:hypothetical protein